MMSTILMIVAPVYYQDNEFEIPRDIFTEAGHTVAVASKGTKVAVGVLGGGVKIDVDISEVDTSTYEAVVFIGGGGASVYFEDEEVHQLVMKFYENGAVVAAICIAPSTLANSGILYGKRSTAFPTEQAHLVSEGAIWTENDVEVDGRIVTANGPAAAQKFANEIVKLLPVV